MVFMDTPGIHDPKTPLHRSMVASAEAAFQEVDIILSMIEVHRALDPNISVIPVQLRTWKKPTILVINKIDMASKEALLPIMETYGKDYSFEAIVPISALQGDGLDQLLEEIKGRLTPGPAFFPEDMTTDQAESFLVSEIIREKIYLHTKNEIPYSSAVSVESIEEVPKKNLITISALIHVESESQKAILIGHKGRMVKTIGRASRIDLERFFSSRIFLDLLVRVEKNWSKDPKALQKMGY
jgi:GTP-binding protein Era